MVKGVDVMQSGQAEFRGYTGKTVLHVIIAGFLGVGFTHIRNDPCGATVLQI